VACELQRHGFPACAGTTMWRLRRNDELGSRPSPGRPNGNDRGLVRCYAGWKVESDLTFLRVTVLNPDWVPGFAIRWRLQGPHRTRL